jgi:hypothetical protein
LNEDGLLCRKFFDPELGETITQFKLENSRDIDAYLVRLARHGGTIADELARLQLCFPHLPLSNITNRKEAIAAIRELRGDYAEALADSLPSGRLFQ